MFTAWGCVLEINLWDLRFAWQAAVHALLEWLMHVLMYVWLCVVQINLSVTQVSHFALIRSSQSFSYKNKHNSLTGNSDVQYMHCVIYAISGRKVIAILILLKFLRHSCGEIHINNEIKLKRISPLWKFLLMSVWFQFNIPVSCLNGCTYPNNNLTSKHTLWRLGSDLLTPCRMHLCRDIGKWRVNVIPMNQSLQVDAGVGISRHVRFECSKPSWFEIYQRMYQNRNDKYPSLSCKAKVFQQYWVLDTQVISLLV